jgi:ribosomal protein S18 acetylase RimI-like enzyme
MNEVNHGKMVMTDSLQTRVLAIPADEAQGWVSRIDTLHDAVWGAPEGDSSLTDCVALHHASGSVHTYLLSVRDDELLAMLIYRHPGVPCQFEIMSATVDPRYRRRGLMKELLNWFREQYPRAYFWGLVRKNNGPALALYRGLGAKSDNLKDDPDRLHMGWDDGSLDALEATAWYEAEAGIGGQNS